MNFKDKLLHYMFFCHRIPERSFFYKGKQFPICARCTGILGGYLIGLIYVILVREIYIVFELVLIIPLVIDGLGQLYGYWKSNNRRRFITGILGGVTTISLLRLACVLGLRSGQYVATLLK